MKKILFVLLLLVGWYQYFYIGSSPAVGEGMLSGGLPYQSATDKRLFKKGDLSFTPTKALELDARVLAASHYYFDQMSRISKTDLLVGWRELSDEAVINKLDFSTSGRDYAWENPNKIISDEFVRGNTKLLHTIAANEQVERLLNSIRIGDVIFARGYVVNVKSTSGISWKTALKNDLNSRRVIKRKTSKGDIFYIEYLEVVNPYSRIY